MYIARYEIGEDTWLQAVVDIPRAYGGDLQADRWSATLKSIVHDLLSRPEFRPSYRVSFDNHVVDRTFFLSAPAHSEANLRRLLALFLRLDLQIDNSVWLGDSRSEHDRHVEAFPSCRCHLSVPHYSAGDAWLACDFSLLGRMSALLTEAALRGYEFSYHVNLEPLVYSPNNIREASRNLLRLRGNQGVTASLADRQQTLVERLKTAGYLAEEFLGAVDSDSIDWLRTVLRGHFNRDYASVRMEAPEFTFERAGFEGSLIAMRHRSAFEALTLSEIVSSCVNGEEVEDALSWAPPREFSQPTPPPEPVSATPEVANLPTPYDGLDDYVFVSYKREDLPRIAPILREAVSVGQKIWFDKGIPGGAEWDAIIEERLAHCKMVMLFVSQAAIRSRYVRREVKFADTLNKPVLSLRLENAVLSNGMAMFLNQYQMMDVENVNFRRELQRAFSHVKPP
jgi:TIR domain